MALRPRPVEEASMNLTPMIDVVFLLVVFFMVGAKFREEESRIPVNVPGVGSVRPMVRGPDEKIVELTRDGEVTLDAQPVSLTDLQGTLSQAHAAYPDLRVTVRGDGSGSLQRFAEVLQACRSSGVENLGIAVRPVRR
jgi:biopolymer transport protein ExbD